MGWELVAAGTEHNAGLIPVKERGREGKEERPEEFNSEKVLARLSGVLKLKLPTRGILHLPGMGLP